MQRILSRTMEERVIEGFMQQKLLSAGQMHEEEPCSYYNCVILPQITPKLVPHLTDVQVAEHGLQTMRERMELSLNMQEAPFCYTRLIPSRCNVTFVINRMLPSITCYLIISC